MQIIQDWSHAACSSTQVKYVQVYGMDIKRTSSFNFFHGLDIFSTHNFAFMNKYKCIVQILMLGKVGNRIGQSYSQKEIRGRDFLHAFKKWTLLH